MADDSNPHSNAETADCESAAANPSFCANNCGFFGNPATMDLCSQCYSDLLRRRTSADSNSSEQSTTEQSTTVTLTETLTPSVTEPVAMDVITPAVSITETPSPAPQIDQPSTQISAADLLFPDPNPNPNSASTSSRSSPNRCFCCRKRVGLLGFKCRCGNVFCAHHRYSDRHACSFDYRGAARAAIAKANPVVKGDKLDRI